VAGNEEKHEAAMISHTGNIPNLSVGLENGDSAMDVQACQPIPSFPFLPLLAQFLVRFINLSVILVGKQSKYTVPYSSK